MKNRELRDNLIWLINSLMWLKAKTELSLILTLNYRTDIYSSCNITNNIFDFLKVKWEIETIELIHLNHIQFRVKA